MATLPQAERLLWLASLAVRVRERSPPAGDILWQELREVARGCRLALAPAIRAEHGDVDPAYALALLEVPRERFVRPEDIERSSDDTPLPLDDEGSATISAPHAYALMFRLLGLKQGDDVVELGTGSGYGAALAAFVTGREVRTFEIDPALCALARKALVGSGPVTVIHADAVESALDWGQALKVCVTFAVTRVPQAWLKALPEGGRLVVPVGDDAQHQRLILIEREQGRIVRSDHGAVRYVRNRSQR
jgi:protein-L-isoaspartate(D-aspartate) O-methyltransferase